MEPSFITEREYADIFGENSDEEEFFGFAEDEVRSDVGFSDLASSYSDSDVVEEEQSGDEVGDVLGQNAWTRDLTDTDCLEFQEETGPTFQFNPQEEREIDIFEKIFTIALLQFIVKETNRNAREKLRGNEQRLQLWEDVNEIELRAYFGVLIAMGITNLPELHMYWSTDPMYGNEGIKKVFSRDRFKEIGRFLHFSNSAEEPKRGEQGYDRLFKVRHILEHTRENFKKAYKPGKNLSIDEGMIAYKGRIGFKQYMPQKPIKYGMKVWLCADPQNGYVLNHEVYLGKEREGQDLYAGKGLGYYVVMNMTEPYHGKSHHAYFDNFFSSPELMEDLLFDKQTYACGTVRRNRKGLPKFDGKKMGKGDIIVHQKGESNLMLTTWKDKREINVLSTNSSPLEPPRNIIRRGKKGVQEVVEKPAVVCLYNAYMIGVDLSDQLRSYYPLGRKGHRWYKYIFWFLFDVSVGNAMVLWNEFQPQETNRRRSGLKFRQSLAMQMIGGYCGRKSAIKKNIAYNRCDPGAIREEAKYGHFICKIEGRKKECIQCKRLGRKTPKRRPRETSWKCSHCDIPLCKDNCFLEYHS